MTQKTKFKETEIGKVPEDWESVEVGDLIKYRKGYAFKSKWFQETGKRICKVGDFTQDSIDISRTLFIDEKKAEEFKDFGINEGDIVIATVGSWPNNPASIVGKVIRVPKKAEGSLMNQNAVIIRAKNSNKLNQEFIYYQLKTKDFSHHIISGAQGSANQASITLRDIFSFEFGLPEINEQEKISNIFSKIDKKISLNQQMNQTLEAIGQVLFKHWFVDFEFPNEKGNPYKSSDGQTIYSNDLDMEIPVDWEVKSFSECIDVNPRRELKKGVIARKVGMADITPWQSCIESWTFEEYKSGSKFKNGDTLFARITPSLEHGKTALVTILEKNEVAFGTTEFIVFSPKIIKSSLFIFHLARDERTREITINEMTGTSGRQRVPNDCFDFLKITLPPNKIIDKFNKILIPVFVSITNNTLENLSLIQIRDALLPKLMSGKIRVKV